MSGYILPLLLDTQLPLSLLTVKQHSTGAKRWAEEEEEAVFKSQPFFEKKYLLIFRERVEKRKKEKH